MPNRATGRLGEMESSHRPVSHHVLQSPQGAQRTQLRPGFRRRCFAELDSKREAQESILDAALIINVILACAARLPSYTSQGIARLS